MTTVYDSKRQVTLWGLPGGISLHFTMEELLDAGFPARQDATILGGKVITPDDVADVFRCNVTIEDISIGTCHYGEDRADG